MSGEVRGNSSRGPAETENPNTNDDNEGVPEWLKEFTENLVDDSVPEHRDASSSSHELPTEPRAKMHRVSIVSSLTSTKDRNCDICLITKITRAPYRRRIGTVVPRAENVG